MLKRIHIPTWIKQSIPVLGKASFGCLKAHEWCNLFTMQLPLLLPHLWGNGNPINQSLLHNFTHLVSLFSIALKQVMNDNHIAAYCHHIHSYIEICQTFFPNTQLVPNHHMAFHLGNYLERFGPSGAWYSFSIERLMAQVLNSTGNNSRLSFLIMGSRALLQSRSFPPDLDPFIQQIRDPLDLQLFECLLTQLNKRLPVDNRKWISSEAWDKAKFKYNLLTTNSRVEYSSICNLLQGFYDKPRETWFAIKPLSPLAATYNSFSHLDNTFDVSLQTLDDSPIYLFHSDELFAHCAWMKYSRELNSKIATETFALVCLDRLLTPGGATSTTLKLAPSCLINNWDLFKQQLFTLFGDPNEVRNTKFELNSLSMKDNSKASTYIAQFRTLQSRVDWNDAAFAFHF
ncbi:hypothetical protein VP01_310g12 [Puccinia sorghi]|uniref:Uncharacterized protein n=1 Tax=Puccinia sorghi TaxID=27349 RepID=A0A0L6UZJ6_9BASI|nr:hypothetical protein VP01_310g12 [Puccinia sorghi]